ncbi:helix-turn-helix domain-containing protein [Bacillus massilinigeriensis]|uniref:helix-turn-helix domain-containing protein n=1 Tax=Bacillus mediterraneensis TaxID=1805474 RepID=UPI0008F929FF|nr:helix-turn-helix transcriptional regulator [Bacillus mediterraneensis]
MDEPLYLNLLKNRMKELGITDEELAGKTNLSISTIKYFKSDPQWNIRLDSLIKILIATKTPFHEMIKMPNYIQYQIELASKELLKKELHKNPSSSKIPYFTKENTHLLQSLFKQAEIPVTINPYNFLKSINLSTVQSGVPIVLHMNLAVYPDTKSCITILNSFIAVNTYYNNLETVMVDCIDIIERFISEMGIKKLQYISL